MVVLDKNLFLETVGFLMGQKFAINAPKKSTRLARAFTSTMKVENNTVTYTLPHYAKQVIEGSPPHVITVKDKKSLAVPINKWTGTKVNPYGSGKFPMLSKDGKFVLLGKKVNHPGNEPNFFVQQTIHQEIKGIIEQAIRLSIKR